MAITAQYTYVLTGAANVVVGAASASVAIPSGAEFVALATVANCHWRMGKGAQTAIATDPLLTINAGAQIIRVPAGADTFAVIQDGASAGNCNIAMVTEH